MGHRSRSSCINMGYGIACPPKDSRAGRTHRTQPSPCVAHTSRLHRIGQRPARRHACGPRVDEELEPMGTINGSLLLAWRLRPCPCRLLTATQWTTTRAVGDRRCQGVQRRRGCRSQLHVAHRRTVSMYLYTVRLTSLAGDARNGPCLLHDCRCRPRHAVLIHRSLRLFKSRVSRQISMRG